MAITEQQAKDLIVLRTGDVDPTTGDRTTASSGVVRTNIDLLWEANAAADLIRPGLRLLYCQRDALDLILAILAERVDTQEHSTGLQAEESQFRVAKEHARREVQRQIERIEKQVAAAGGARGTGGALRQLTRTAPVMPATSWEADPNDPRYGGTAVRDGVHR